MTDLEKLREEIAQSFLLPLGYVSVKTLAEAERVWVGNNIDDAETGSLAYLCRSLADTVLSIPSISERLKD